MAYASLVSLVNILQQNIELNLIPQNNGYIQTLLEEASFFQDFLENSSRRSSGKIKCLENRIRDAAYKAQHIVDSNVVDRLDDSVFCLASLFEEYSDEIDWDECLFHNLDQVMQEINSIKLEAMQIEEKRKEEDENNNNNEPEHQPRISPPAGSSRPHLDGMTTMVGLDDDFKQIKTRLVTGLLQLEIVALVGMGGIGKTTLARKVHDDKFISSHFDTSRWVTISQEYSIQSILEGLLGNEKKSKENNETLGLDLYKSLKNRRYLIVLDDMWDTKVWDDLKRVLPNDENGSRILLTTRLEHVAKHENSCPPHHVPLLNNEEGWGLFCEKVFRRGCCPPELEKIGKAIVKNCRGLPLAIKVIGGHFSKATRAEHYWRSVAKNLSETIALEDDEQCSRVLSLSYKQLPHHLKGCFLYMSIFKEDYEIQVSILVRLWVASGIIKQERSKSLEDSADAYFLDLVDRNLILVSKRKYNGRIKQCKIHDLIRDLCVKEAKNERFSHITDKTCYYHEVQEHVPQHNKHLRAFYFADRGMAFHSTMVDHQTGLQYLYCREGGQGYWNATASFQKLLHMHTIDLFLGHVAFNIWEMPQLRHVKIRFFVTLPDPSPPKIEVEKSIIVLENLQTLYTVENLIFTNEVFRRIPNLKKLGISYFEGEYDLGTDWRDFGPNNLECLHKLESLECSFSKTPVLLKRDITFPHWIKELTLERCHSPWEDMTVVGSLPSLQVLKLRDNAFTGEEWEPNEGEFRNLKTLLLRDIDLVHWRTEADHFPKLQHLLIGRCEKLQEIPSDIGEIPALQLIQLHWVGESVYSSARQIEEEQHNFGNEGFQVITQHVY